MENLNRLTVKKLHAVLEKIMAENPEVRDSYFDVAPLQWGQIHYLIIPDLKDTSAYRVGAIN